MPRAETVAGHGAGLLAIDRDAGVQRLQCLQRQAGEDRVERRRDLLVFLSTESRTTGAGA